MVCRIGSIDMEMYDRDDQKAILSVFQQIINSFHGHVQLLTKRVPLNFSQQIIEVNANIEECPHENVQKYGESYISFLDEVANGKLTTVDYLILKADRYCDETNALASLGSIRDQVERILKPLNISVEQLTGKALGNFFEVPKFVQEKRDYAIYGEEYRRTYIIQNYPRVVYANWLKPLLEFPFPVEITQHYHPFSRDSIVRTLELNISKLQSTVDMVERNGFGSGSEVKTRKKDAEELLKRVSSGADSVFQVGVAVTVVANSLEELEKNSYLIEGAIRSVQLTARRAIFEGNKALISTMPFCDWKMEDWYTLDSRSMSTMIPWTTATCDTKSGIFYGINEQTNSLITFNRFDEQNANQIILGTSGAGKSMTAKTVEISRQLVSGSQVFVIDWSGEYREICLLLGGQYISDQEEPEPWDGHLIVFSGDAVKNLRKVWNYINANPDRKRVLVVDECHNVLRSDPNLVLTVMQEIRKRFCATTLITPNVQEFLRSPEGKMIIDLCSIKILHRLGENDVKEAAELFGLSKNEKMYLRTCGQGHGLIYTANCKTKIKIAYSDREEKLLTTNPLAKVAAK